MADVKWIKLSVGMFDNRKIKYLRSLPEGNNIILIWVMLLTVAGRCNAGGMIFLTENVPYTTKMLADELDFDENIIVLALNALRKLGMIDYYDETLLIAGWEEHQNTDGLEKIREQNRIRKQKQRDKERLLLTDNSTGHVTCHVTVTQCHATDIDKDIDIDIDKDIYIPSTDVTGNTSEKTVTKKKTETKHKYGEYNHVLLKDSELEKLNSDYGCDKTEQAIKYLDEYIEMKGTKYKSHYLVMRKWVFEAVKDKAKSGAMQPQKQQQVNNKFNNFQQRKYSKEDFRKMEQLLLNKG